ncbi:MAG: hypothetical protein LBC97_13745 [Bifidobacteriaceae bacterium]|jgi:hypothetical protein|nr:hypothetical protein [Bifidobacteriaceae bacterium]
MSRGGGTRGAGGEAERRRRASDRRAAESERGRLERELAGCGLRLAALDSAREGLLAERDRLVSEALAEGWTLARAARTAGASRQALMKRLRVRSL